MAKLIAGTMYDRRRKLSEEQKEEIRELSKELSMRELSERYGVSRWMINLILHPEKYEQVMAKNRERRKDGRYKCSAERSKEIMMEHYDYVARLKKEGAIK